eukprot:1247399-Alexandrium_andersonii.AAC.1
MAGAASLGERGKAIAGTVRTAQPGDARRRRLARSSNPRARPQAQAVRGALPRGLGVQVRLE